MTDIEDSAPKKKLSLSRPGKLELKKTVEGGQVRQSFSHGRSKVVTVEVKKKRTFEAGTDGMKEVHEGPDPVFTDVPKEAAEPPPPPPVALRGQSAKSACGVCCGVPQVLVIAESSKSSASAPSALVYT